MNLIRKIAVVIVALGASSNASADPMFSFSYTFDTGEVLAGLLEGVLQADLDTIQVNSFDSVTLDGVALPSIEESDIRSASDFPFWTGALPPLVSLSGQIMDIFVCAQGFSINNNCSFGDDGGFVLGGQFYDQPEGPGAGAGDGLGVDVFEPFSANRWRLSAVPEPSTLALFALGLAGMGLSRRREQPA